MKRLFWQRIPTIVLWTMFGLAVFVLLATFTGLNTALVWPLVRDETPRSTDVIIVLGGGLIRETQSLPWGVEERMRKGVEMYTGQYATKIIVTGGLAWHGGLAESEVMAPYAEMLGVPAADIVQENRASDTRTNASRSQAIMAQNGWRTALLVTSDFHTQRACHVFLKQKIDVTCVAAYKNPAMAGDPFRNLMDLRAIVREYAATVYYWLKGWI